MRNWQPLKSTKCFKGKLYRSASGVAIMPWWPERIRLSVLEPDAAVNATQRSRSEAWDEDNGKLTLTFLIPLPLWWRKTSFTLVTNFVASWFQKSGFSLLFVFFGICIPKVCMSRMRRSTFFQRCLHLVDRQAVTAASFTVISERILIKMSSGSVLILSWFCRRNSN